MELSRHVYACSGDATACFERLRNLDRSPDADPAFAWDETTTVKACECNHVACLRLALINGCPWVRTGYAEAAKRGHLDCLSFAHQYGCMGWDEKVLLYAVEHGQVACLEYAHRHGGLQLNDQVWLHAIRHDQADCLRYMHEKAGYPIDLVEWEDGALHISAIAMAVCQGAIRCFRYALERGSKEREPGSVSWSACHYGNLEILRIAHAHGLPWTRQIIRAAILGQYGRPYDAPNEVRFEVFKYLYENGAPVYKDTCTHAIECGRLEILRYLVDRGHRLPKDACTRAAHCAKLEVLQYLRAETPCRWNAVTCARGAYRLPVLQFLHENGCPWDERCFKRAIDDDNPECMRYLREHGCPGDLAACKQQAIQNNSSECLAFFEEIEREGRGAGPGPGPKGTNLVCPGCALPALREGRLLDIDWSSQAITQSSLPEFRTFFCSIRKLQRHWGRAYWNPAYSVCIRRKRREFEELTAATVALLSK